MISVEDLNEEDEIF